MNILVIMKRKTASRKKPAYKTKRNSRRRARTTRVKRGGMLNRRIMPSVREMIYHNILPLITAKQIIYRTGIEPKPSDYEITKDYERYYRTFADIPGDDGIKESIRNLRDELKDPVKNLGKIKDLYDAINKTLEEKRKKSMPAGKTSIDTTVNKFFQSSSPPDMFLLRQPSPTNQENTMSPLTLMNKDQLSSLVNQPFGTPKRPDYSSSLKSPTKPFVKSIDDTYPDASSRHLQSPGFNRRGRLSYDDEEDDDGDKDVKEDDDEDDEDDEDE